MPNFHEDLAREEIVKGPGNRKFGLTFAGLFALFAAIGFYREWRLVWLFVALAPVSLVLALKFPDVLEGPNRAWLKLGLLLNRIVSPVIMLMLFFLVVAPLGFILKLFNKDLLGLRREPAATSYWLPRTDARPASESMRQQF
jgi:hypothetical protein